ncbi:MAG: hypothetical protein WCS54_02785 [Fibrobacteraceae bacterium]
MDAKKMKIILGVSIAVNVVLIVLMFTLKSGYKEQAQKAVSVSTKAYTDQVAKVVNAQNTFISTSNMIWQLTFETLSGDRSESAFDARLAAIDTGHQLQVSKASGKTTIACGAGCSVSYQFAGGNLVKADYAALYSFAPESEFSVMAPPAFNFQMK